MGIGKFLTQTALVVVAVAGASAASATNFFLGAVGSNFYIDPIASTPTTTFAYFNNSFNPVPAGGVFDDSFIFGVNVLSVGSGSVSTSVQGLKITNVFFNGTDYSSSIVANGAAAVINNLAVLTGQANTLRLVGSITTPGGYNGNATISPAAVPEPATWAMMVVGFGALGAACRRSRASAAKVSFS